MTNPNLKNAVHASDFAAYEKYLTGQWMIDTVNGEIITRSTGQPIKFKKSKTGYLSIRTTCRGRHIDVVKHRAVWVIANGVPFDFYAEVDHINGDKEDCRLKNLRLVSHAENARSTCILTMEAAEQIRREYEKGETTLDMLGRKYNCSQSTIHRIVTNKTYTNFQNHVTEKFQN